MAETAELQLIITRDNFEQYRSTINYATFLPTHTRTAIVQTCTGKSFFYSAPIRSSTLSKIRQMKDVMRELSYTNVYFYSDVLISFMSLALWLI